VTARRALLALLLLAGCEASPQPFRGRPGATARRLAAPPAYRVAVPASADALLSETRAASYSENLAAALTEQEIPAIAGEPWPLDWRVVVKAVREGNAVLLRYELLDGDGTSLGERGGARIPAARWQGADESLLAEVARRDRLCLGDREPHRERCGCFARVRGLVDRGRVDRVRGKADLAQEVEPPRRGGGEHEERPGRCRPRCLGNVYLKRNVMRPFVRS